MVSTTKPLDETAEPNLSMKRLHMKAEYDLFLQKAAKNPDFRYVVVDGLPRSGTNFLRNLCSRMAVDDVCLQYAQHYFDSHQYADGFLHGSNVIHLFPLRDNVMDSMYSVLGLRKVFLKDDPIKETWGILEATKKALKFVTEQDVKNIYFVRVSNLERVAMVVRSLFLKHGIPHMQTDAGEMIVDLSKDEDPDNIRSNRFPISNARKNQEILAAKELLSLEIFSTTIEEIKRLYQLLLKRSL